MANKDVITHKDLAMLDPDGVFPARLAADRASLVAWLSDMRDGSPKFCGEQLSRIATLSHRLAGAAGTFGYAGISDRALALEELIVDRPPGLDGLVWIDSVHRAADALVCTLDDALVG
jgi:hypothetical protein